MDDAVLCRKEHGNIKFLDVDGLLIECGPFRCVLSQKFLSCCGRCVCCCKV